MDRVRTLRKLIRISLVTILTFVFWLFLSRDLGSVAILAAFVPAVAAAIYSYSIFYDQNIVHTARLVIRIDYLALYFLVILIQSYIATIELIYLMLTGNYTPGIVRIKTRLRSRFGRTILANTITVIPGTLSLWMDGRNIYVHWFDVKTHHSIKAGKIIKNRIENLLLKVFG